MKQDTIFQNKYSIINDMNFISHDFLIAIVLERERLNYVGCAMSTALKHPIFLLLFWKAK